MILRLDGHHVRSAYCSREALEAMPVHKPDVALLDIGLPDMDGYELARRIRAQPDLGGIRLVALSGYGQAEDKKRARVAGFDDYLVKPVELPALQRALARSRAA
jgi:CheY-like chemotaxis protein